MAIFYKYYSYLPLHYFHNPTIKIATPAHLNDPFESLLPSDIEDYIYRFIDENEGNLIYDKRDTVVTLINLMRMYGIVSLSETQRNLLMWAHYANEHRGLCIGYEINELFVDDIKERLEKDCELRKVNYDSVRHENFGNIKSFNNMVEVGNYILYKIMLTKGNDWIYEKEHRFIIPLSKASYVQTRLNDVNKNDKFKRVIEEMIREEYIEKSESPKGCNDDDILCYSPVTDESRHGFGYLNFFKEASYFLNINPKAIKRIYFGCRASNEYKTSVIDAINKNKELYEKVFINNMSLDKNRFELYVNTKEELII